MSSTAPLNFRASPREAHPLVIERTEGDGVTVTMLAPRNPFRLGHITPLIFGPVFLAFAMLLTIVLFRGNALVGALVLTMLACGLAWLTIELPELLSGLHTRAEIRVAADEVRATVRYLWVTRTHAYRRDQVIGVRVVSSLWQTRAVHLRVTSGDPLEIMAGFPDEQIDAAAATLRRALSDVAPVEPVIRADDVGTLPYRGDGRAYEVEVRRFADGSVSAVIPPPMRNATRTLGGVIFAVMWLAMFAFMFQITWRALWWCPFIPLTLIGGTYALAVAARDYLRRNEPLVIVRTRDELVIENAPRFRKVRRIPRGEIQSIECGPSGRERRFVLLIKAKREIELMVARETDEIERVVNALNLKSEI